MKNFVGKEADKFKLQNRIFELLVRDPECFIELLSQFIDEVGAKNRKSVSWGVNYSFT